MSKENYVNYVRPHDSAYKHVSGYAEYTDDINEPKNTIYGAIGLSKKAHAIIKNIDLTEVNAQNDFAASGDSATAGFELLDVSISRSFALEGVEDFEVVLFANNLLDEIARNHSSTVKNEVPLPGKNLGIGFRVTL